MAYNSLVHHFVRLTLSHACLLILVYYADVYSAAFLFHFIHSSEAMRAQHRFSGNSSELCCDTLTHYCIVVTFYWQAWQTMSLLCSNLISRTFNKMQFAGKRCSKFGRFTRNGIIIIVEVPYDFENSFHFIQIDMCVCVCWMLTWCHIWMVMLMITVCVTAIEFDVKK